MHDNTFAFAIRIIDEGLRIYRRHAVLLLLNAAILLVPLGILVGVLIATASWAETNDWFWILVFLAILLVYPLAVYTLASLSLTARELLNGRVPTLREVLWIPPLRLISLCVFTFIHSVVLQIIFSVLAVLLAGMGYVAVFAFAAVVGAIDVDESMLIGLILIGILAFLSIYGISVVVSMTSSCGTVYGLQIWLDPTPVRERMGTSIEMTFYHFIRNAITWFLCALVLVAVGAAAVTAVGAAVSLPLILTLGEDSTITQALSATAWVLALMLIIPPLPIWMALLYRHNRQQATAPDLAERVHAWHAAITNHRPPLATE